MAAREGHVELCKFFLQETAHPDEDAILSSALRTSLYYATSYQFQANEKVRQAKLEAVYNHFVDILGSNIDLSDITVTSSALPFEGFMYMTDTALKSVLASHPISFMNLPFAQKFATAVECIGWPADAFSMLLRQYEPTEAVKKTNAYGKTALHWAAEHFGEWSRRTWTRNAAYTSLRTNEYARLATELVSIGANVHAVYHEPREDFTRLRYAQQIDPFLALLEGVITESMFPWRTDGLHDAVSRWGQILVEGGHDLVDYVSTVNKFLKSITWNHQHPFHRFRALGSEWPYIPVRLLVSEHSKLILEIKRVPSVRTWEATVQSAPGAWPIAAKLPDVIAWEPQEMDLRDGICWVPVRDVPFTSEPYEIRPSESSKKDLHDSLQFDVGKEIQENQDDHGFVARIHSRGSTGWRQIGARLGHRRSSSSPPSLPKHGSFLFGVPTAYEHITSGSGYHYKIHKCPLDAQWRICGDNLIYDGWRRCMQGLCHEQTDTSDIWHELTFEGWFLRNEEYVHVAKRYAEKFCPERMDIVDVTLERVTERKRLAMGPKRRADSN